MVDIQNIKIEYAAHSKQKIFHNSKTKFRAFVGGIGSGKSYAGSIETILFCINNPGCLFVIAAPTYPMLRDATIRTFMDVCPPELIKNYNSSDNVISLVNGSEILCRSCEDLRTIERLRGTNIAGFWIDEAAMVPKLAWKVLIGRLRQSKMQLRGWITTSPRGFNWVYEVFVENNNKNYELIPCSSKENPYLSSEYIEDLELSYTGVFAKQEIMGEFVGFEGLVYDEFSRDKHVVPVDISKMKRFVAGVDWGYTNPSVVIVIGIDYDNRMYIVEEFYQSKVLMTEFMGIINQLKNKYKIETFYCDPSEPQYIQQLQLDGINAIKANNEIMPGLNSVGARLKIKGDGTAGLYINTTCLHTIMEFENYRYPDKKLDKAPQEKPIKLYDHAMDSIRYAIMGEESGVVDYSPMIA